jgi:hypothetical protein
MENDSDALTSDKLRHKACAVPTKLDINNTQVYFQQILQMADGIPEYLQTATHVKTRKPRKRVLKDRLSMKARRLLQCQRLQQTQPQLKPVTVPETVTNTITASQRTSHTGRIRSCGSASWYNGR